jgi:hypothetical protein
MFRVVINIAIAVMHMNIVVLRVRELDMGVNRTTGYDGVNAATIGNRQWVKLNALDAWKLKVYVVDRALNDS